MQKKVTKIGISIYCRSELEKILSRYPLDLVQIPINIFDQRLLEDGFLRNIKEKGIEIHARSVFLQGLLLQKPKDIKTYFNPINQKLSELRGYANSLGISVLELCLKFVLGIKEVDRVVIGFNNSQQLSEVCSALESNSNLSGVNFKGLDESKFLNPNQWEKK
tara:strand:- start:111 stop:599 length:489 start_codon:yes stop_codon:yes gene_type:complete